MNNVTQVKGQNELKIFLLLCFFYIVHAQITVEESQYFLDNLFSRYRKINT